MMQPDSCFLNNSELKPLALGGHLFLGTFGKKRISTDLIRGLMEGNAYPVLGNGGVQLEGKALQTFQKSFVQVENILDQNRVLINEINQNQESKIPDNLSRNVGLIRELNNNIRKVVNLYSDLSSNFSKSMDVEGDSRLDAKALLKRNKPA
ncbi:hypothetical protein E3N88_09803 [Mikania micrantha]|uniref:Protein EARLY FLOWERING 4 domain-containing protein n=1 Tax=Mikania micrantha TaxID=192012 RepID=A0A5N6PL11_9ASTR|nr:hypothetical protein E3N88_09803 [Mikania micrantha]